jgi:adenylate cyclase
MRRFLRIPNRLPVRLPDRQTSQKWLAAGVIAGLTTLIAIAWRHTAVISIPMGLLDDVLYDSMYRFRAPESRKDGPVVIVAISQGDLDRLRKPEDGSPGYPWPWPRAFYGMMVQYLEQCGAKAVVFDMLFSEPSVHQRAYNDDDEFAEQINAARIPVVFATRVGSDGKPGNFQPPVTNPILGGADPPQGVLREYAPLTSGFPSLAYRAVEAFRGTPPGRTEPFYLHYYGPHIIEGPPAVAATAAAVSDGGGATTRPGHDDHAPGASPAPEHTYRYVGASDVIAAAGGEVHPDVRPEVFRGKVVLIGGLAAALQDVKTMPLSREYPGVEFQATAIENLLNGQQVRVVPRVPAGALTLAAAFLAAGGTLIPRRVPVKLTAAGLVIAAMVLLAVVLFTRPQIRYLPLAAPLVALLGSTLVAFAWSYFTEDRQRQFFSNAFALSTSPVIAEAITRNQAKLKLGGERREITVMFTDLAGFTDLSETMEVVKLAQVINLYMEAMSDEIVRQDGYLDKYIGDAIMSFWNGLVDQPEHAARACRAALAVKRRELEIGPELQKLVEARIVTRIGVHTGPMAVGNLGSSRKLSYTVLGDSVNLAARLEPANKLYGSEVLISQVTAEQVKGLFVVRELDLLRVKGKQKPMGVYELMGEGEPTPELRARVEQYGDGLAHYRAQRWDDAEATLRKLLNDFPADEPAAALLKRVAKLRHEDLGPNWDGVYVAKEK